MKKKILQAVSGGFDSTYLLIKNLQNGDTVQPLYVHVNSIDKIKQKIESTIVKNLITKLQVKYDNLNDLKEVEIGIDNIPNIVSDQPIYWTLALFKEVRKNGYYRNYNEVHIGYILQDAAISYIPELRALWKALHSFSYPDHDFVVPKLCFPISKYHKTQIISSLRYSCDEDILASCWTCERPDIKKKIRRKDTVELNIEPCGSCATCLHLKEANSTVFNNMKNYRFILHVNDFKKDVNTSVDKIINKVDFQRFPDIHVSLEEDKKREKNKPPAANHEVSKVLF